MLLINPVQIGPSFHVPNEDMPKFHEEIKALRVEFTPGKPKDADDHHQRESRLWRALATKHPEWLKEMEAMNG